uniref:DUF7636 domain-containing protein n=1 Tax=Ditylenchus dipsaci TaxID=166011 RepID=A0A915D921_9BILA
MEPDLGYPSVFYQNQWSPINESAMITFHSIAFTLRLKSLPCTKRQEEMYSEDMPENVFEADPFLIEVPLQHSQVFSDPTYSQHISRQLCVKTGCTHIVFRALPVSHGRETCRFYVSAKGSMDSISKIRFLASPRPRVSMSTNEKDSIARR